GSSRRFVFDSGVQDISGLGPKGALRRLLSELGAQERITWRRVLHRYLQDGLCIDIPEDPAQLSKTLCDVFPSEASAIAAFLSEIGAVCQDLYDGFDQTRRLPPPRTSEAIAAWSAHHPRAARWMDHPYSEMLASFVTNPTLNRFFTTISEYVTDRPDCLSVGEMAPLFSYYFEGGFYPAGGSQRLANLLRATIVENGGMVLLRTHVTEILVENQRVTGLLTPKANYHAPIVIANGDAVRSLTNLIDPLPLPRR